MIDIVKTIIVHAANVFMKFLLFHITHILYGVKRRSLVPDLVTCYSRDAQREWMKLKRSREQKREILKRCANDFSQRVEEFRSREI